MNYEQLKTAANTIRMPEEMKQRITEACNQHRTKMEEHTMKNHTRFAAKPAALFAALAVCLSLAVTAVGAPGIIKGQFRDLTNWQGAIVGTSYEKATDEISLSVSVNGNTLTALAAFADPQQIPYCNAEQLGIGTYQILDADGKAVKEGRAASSDVINGQVSLHIPLDGIESGIYTLVVSSFVAEKKADQPLPINGHWECACVK